MLPPARQTIRILSADRSDLLRLGARLTLEEHPDCQVLAEAGDFVTLVQHAQAHQPDVILIGEGLDAALTLKQQVAALQAAAPQARLLVLCSPVSGWLVQELLAQGVAGVVDKADDLYRQNQLLCAIFAVMRQRPYLSTTASTAYLIAMQSPQTREPLDAEAYQVLTGLAQGETIGEISERLNIHLRRIYWVREKLRRRFSARTNEHLVGRAVAEGFVVPRD